MNIGLLGEFELECPGAPHKLPPRCRSVLSALALRANCSVSMEQLVSWVWDKEDLPRRPDSALQTYISRIRSCFDGEARRVRTLSDGYLLEIETSSVDALKFEGSVIAALSTPSGAVDVDAIARALALWRGPTLADVPVTNAINAERRRFEELRLRALAARNEEMLKSGGAADVISDLQTLVYENPYHEGFICQLLTAMAQLGRRADALAMYRAVYCQFRDELGMEPGEEIRARHEALLAESAPNPGRTTRFVGGVRERAAESKLTENSQGRLIGARDKQIERMAAPRLRAALGLTPVTVITGEPGAGATTVALKYSTKHRDQFSGGINFVCATSDARSLPWQLPARSDPHNARPRMVILDGVESVDQVRSWLVADADHLVVTTTRRLTGLPHLNLIRLDPLSNADAMDALQATISSQTFSLTANTLKRLVSVCEGNVLALTIIAASVVDESFGNANHLVKMLDAGIGDFVASLRYGELSVVQSFRRAIFACGEKGTRMLQAVALAERTSAVTAEEVATQVGCQPLLARETLRELAERHLVSVSRAANCDEPLFSMRRLCTGALKVLGDGESRKIGCEYGDSEQKES
jgi:DNA-binding SARP family transcriptional activator